MSTPFVDLLGDGPVTLPPDPEFDGTQTARGGLVLEWGALIILDPSLYTVPGVYTLVTWPGSTLQFVPPQPANPPTLDGYLNVDGSELVGLAIQSVNLDMSAQKITVTLVSA